MNEVMQAGAEPAAGSFQRAFQDRLDQIEARGKKAGLTLTHICRSAGIARATPDRWRKSSPLSVQLIDKMESVVAEAERARAS